MASEPCHRFNKAGRLVIRLQTSKLIEAHSPVHARFLEALHRHPALAPLLPPLLDRRGPFLEQGWVVARRWARPSPAALAALLQRFHQADIAPLPACGFDYWADFLVPRCLRASQLLALEPQVPPLLERCNAWIASQPLTLQHPDLTPANVICSRDAGLCVIDNELCCLGRTALLDVCNALHPLQPAAQRRWLRSYWPDGMPAALIGQLPELAAAWAVRRIGSLAVGGRLQEARRWLESPPGDPAALPFDPMAL